MPYACNLGVLLSDTIGERRAAAISATLEFPAALLRAPAATATRAEIAMSLAMLLFEDLLRRVPMARAYVCELTRAGHGLVFDHGAVRSVAAACGALPSGEAAFARLLAPLGYGRRDVYPMPALGMTGRAWTHEDLPQDLPQYFVSELHPETFSPGFEATVQRVVGASDDPLPNRAKERLARLTADRALARDEARALLIDLVGCFDRHHAPPSWGDYRTLLVESPEMAWISTEGHSFNHVADRVDDVAAVADCQRQLGRPVKDVLEVSASGRVVQTAFRAAEVDRLFANDSGEQLIVRAVPGSFHEFISRQRLPDGSLDLAFDAANAQGIFGMTRTERRA